MNYETISIISFLGSFLGILVILLRKIPVLIELPQSEDKNFEKKNFWVELKNKIKEMRFFKNFSFEIFLQKVLSKIKILILKIENKISNLLQHLREKSQNKNLEKEDYWQKLKKTTKNKLK